MLTCRLISNNHYNKLIADYLTNGKLEKLANDLQNKIDANIKQDPWFYYGYDFFKQSLNIVTNDDIPGIIDLMNRRINYLKENYPELEINL